MVFMVEISVFPEKVIVWGTTESKFGKINVFTFFEDNFEKGKISFLISLFKAKSV